MAKTLNRFFLTAVLGIPFFGGAGFAQDFQRSYVIPAGGGISIRNISGDVKITGYTDNKILVRGFKEGRDRDLVQVEDQSNADHIVLEARYPATHNANAGIRFEVQVPNSIKYNFDGIRTVSGNLEIRSVTGRIRAETVSGNVLISDVTGLVNANSVSGTVQAQVRKLEGTGEMKFSSISGDVLVTLPADLDADVDMSTLSGSLKSDFPVEIREPRVGPGRSARGRLGSGLNNLRIRTISGHVSLTRG